MSETELEATETPPEPQEAPGEPTPEPTPAEPTEPQETPQEGEEEEAGEEPEAVAAEQPAGLSEKEIEAIHKKLDAEANRHAGRVSDILGEQAVDLQPCPLCIPNIPGFIFPVVPPADVTAKVKEVLGEPVEPEYEKANNARECDGCNGYGRRLSGSKVPDQRVLNCPDCNGRGWIGVGTPQNGANAPNATVEFTPEPQVASEPAEATDPWGRRPTDEDYGVMPNLVATRHAVRGS